MEENNQPQPGQQVNEPTTTGPVMDVKPPVTDSQPAPGSSMANESTTESPALSGSQPEQAVSETATPATPQATKQPAAQKRHGAPIVIIVIAVLVASSLAIATMFAFKKDKTPPAANNQNTSTQSSNVTPETVDDTASEIDQSLNSVDESADFPEDELTDQTLGL